MRLIDLSGQRFGRLTVIRRVGTDKHNKVTWLCVCDCGNERVVSAEHLRAGCVKTCGCMPSKPRKPNAAELVGMRFGKLTVVERAGTNRKNRKALWLCKCDCGNETVVESTSLTTGNTQSCGCYSSELKSKRATKHGEAGTRLYRIWQHMKGRCENPTDARFGDYGGRGITLCDEWRNSFETFRDWAFSNGYTEKLTIDRIDVNGNYEPSNCRWATMKEQHKNRRTSINITLNGETRTLAEWTEKMGLNYMTVYTRLHKGWTVERALTTPVKKES